MVVNTLLDLVEEFWPADGWTVKRIEQPPAVVARFVGDTGTWLVSAHSEDARGLLVAYSLFPRACPVSRRGAMLELISRANDELLAGNFEYSFERDEIRFRTSIDLAGLELQPVMWRHLVSANVLTMERYYPAIEAVIEDRASPEEAARAVETL